MSAPAISLAPKLPDFISEKMKCLNNFPCFFISLSSKVFIFERRAFNLGECVGIDSNNLSGLNEVVSNLYSEEDLLQFARFLTQSASNITFIFCDVNFSNVSISCICSKFSKYTGLSSETELSILLSSSL